VGTHAARFYGTVVWSFGKGGVSMPDIFSPYLLVAHLTSTCSTLRCFSQKGVGFWGFFGQFCQKNAYSTFNILSTELPHITCSICGFLANLRYIIEGKLCEKSVV
jgi:hypothetical protein